MKWKLVCKRSFLFLNSQLTKTDSQHRFDPAVVLSLLSCSPPTGWWPKSKHSPRLSKKKMPLPVWGCPTPTHCLRDAIAPSSMPWSLQGPVTYRSYLHTAGALRNIWWDVFSLACHFTLPRSYSYFFWPHDILHMVPEAQSVSFWHRIVIFLMQIFVNMPFCFWCCTAFIPRIWAMLQGLRGYKYWQRIRGQCSNAMALRWKERKKGRVEGRQSDAERRIRMALLEARHRLRLTSLSLTDWWDYPDIFSF